MRYLKKLLLSLNEIFLVFIIQYILLIGVILLIGTDKSIILGSIILMIFEVMYIISKYNSIQISTHNIIYFPYLLLGIALAIIYNMIIFKLGIKFDTIDKMPIVLNILCSGIIGPIFEEILFRYSLINKLEKFNSKRMVIILSSLIFGIFHNNIVTIIYATIVGFVNSSLYLKNKDIMVPIMVHVSGNIIVNLLWSYNFWILILGIMLLVVSILIIQRENC
ncbi:MAG: lysostaphin resistance A-like protein [Bacilli bacterium]